MKISEVINLAINDNLLKGKGPWPRVHKNACSCVAVNAFHPKSTVDERRYALKFLYELGWPESSDFLEFDPGYSRQYARAFALTWAALMAEEEGV